MWVNLGKTKIMVSGSNLNTLIDSGKDPCGVCRKGVGSNSIRCTGCSHWIHKKCSGISGRLKDDPNFRCKQCLGLARPIDPCPFVSMTLGEHPIEVVDSFCYLGDMVTPGGGCESSSSCLGQVP